MHSRQGHLCMTKSESFVSPLISEASHSGLPHTPIVRDRDRYYLQRNWVLETTIVQQLQRLFREEPRKIFNPERLSIPSALSPQQAQVVDAVLVRSVTIVSGGPGTGKTFTAAQMVQSLSRALLADHPLLKIKIAAPTGKAADRLSQSIPSSDCLQVESLTLHRLLGLYPGKNRLFEERTIDADVVIIDEASMMDASLFAHLLQAIPSGVRLVLFGDADQLLPVDGGGVFADLVSIRLTESHRTQDSQLHRLFQAVREGDVNPLYSILEPLPRDLVDWLESQWARFIFSKRPEMEELFRQLDHLRVICPLRKGPHGIEAMNAAMYHRMQKRLQPGQWWAMPILVTHNDENLRLYNGSTGVVVARKSVDHQRLGREEVFFPDGRSFVLDQVSGFEIAFALSAHKSQGSEFEHVICCLPPQSEEFGREALYTAMTRAKKSVRILGDRQTLESMVALKCHHENGIQNRRLLTVSL